MRRLHGGMTSTSTRRLTATSALLAASALAAGCGARTSLDTEREPFTDRPIGVERCNGIDDDGDGEVDEDLGLLQCGVGACARTSPSCIDGAPGECIPGLGSTESCNGIDDDCDGSTDEGLGLVRRAGPYVVDPHAWYLARSSLVATAQGLLLVYATSFNGSAPTPNVFVAHLDADGVPLAGPEVLTVRNMPNGPRLSPWADGWLVTYCGRFGSDDRAASGLLAASGSFVEHGERSPGGKHCGAGDPDGIWSGMRALIGWTDNSNDDVYLDRADGNGVSIEGTTLDDSGDLASLPRFATNGSRLLMVYGRRPVPQASELRVRVLASDGSALGEPLDLAPPSTDGSWSEANVAAQPGGGFLVLASNRFGPGWYRARFDVSGALVSPPDRVPPDQMRIDIGATLVGRTSGYLAAGNASTAEGNYEGFVAALDGQGNITDRWSTTDDPVELYLGWPSIAVRQGRVFVAYSSYMVDDPDYAELRVLELGCAD